MGCVLAAIQSCAQPIYLEMVNNSSVLKCWSSVQVVAKTRMATSFAIQLLMVGDSVWETPARWLAAGHRPFASQSQARPNGTYRTGQKDKPERNVSPRGLEIAVSNARSY